MAQLGFDFKDEEYADYGSKVVLPEGNSNFIIIGSEVKRNKNNSGDNLFIEYSCQDPTGKFQGVSIKECLCVVHSTKDTQDIARQKLATIKRAVGVVGSMPDSVVLHGRAITLRLSVEDNEWTNDKGELIKNKKNEIKGYSKLQTQQTPTQGNAAPASAW